MNNTTDIALSWMTAQDRAMQVIAGNMANISTPGYRGERMVFADLLVGQPRTTTPRGGHELIFVQDRATYRDHAQGTLNHTGNPLDLALSGDGYFSVRTPEGDRLTRAGRFSLQQDGSITDEAGNSLLDANGLTLKLSPADTNITVAADGALSSQNGPIGRIAVIAPQDVNRMRAEGARLFRADTPTQPVANPKIVQGAVEDSNVQPITELTRMITTQRDFQFVSQMVEAEGQRQQSAIDRIAVPVS